MYNRDMDFFGGVECLKGVGPKTAEILRKYGIRTVKDFLYNLPRDYENYARAAFDLERWNKVNCDKRED